MEELMGQVFGRSEIQWKGKREDTPAAISDANGTLLEDRRKILQRYSEYFQNLLTLQRPENAREPK